MGNSREHDASKDRYADSDLSDFRLSDGRTSLGCFLAGCDFRKTLADCWCGHPASRGCIPDMI
jgi:hypothetical protein